MLLTETFPMCGQVLEFIQGSLKKKSTNNKNKTQTKQVRKIHEFGALKSNRFPWISYCHWLW